MFSNYATCTIRIGQSADGLYPLSIHGPGGDAHSVLRLPTDDPTYQELLNNVLFHPGEEKLSKLGQVFFKALFPDKLKEIFVRSQGQLQKDQGLRIILNIAAEAQEIATLPWEFLNDPDQGPLTLLDTPITRYIPLPLRIDSLKTTLPIKVLLTGAQTKAPANARATSGPDTTAANIELELKETQQALASLGNHVSITVEPHLTSRRLQDLLRDGFDVWHFVGHGALNTQGTDSCLMFENGSDGTSLISPTQLGILLNRSRVRLILLNACEGGRLATDPFRSMAPALVRAQVPAVVAMQFAVKQNSARAFAVEFYRALAEGFPIDACVTEGRKAVMNEVGLDRADWGIPVVYTRAEDGRLFDLPQTTSSTILPPTVPEDKRATEIAELNNLLAIKNRRLYELQKRAAYYGINVPVEIALEMEDLAGKKDHKGNLYKIGEIGKIEQRLRELGE